MLIDQRRTKRKVSTLVTLFYISISLPLRRNSSKSTIFFCLQVVAGHWNGKGMGNGIREVMNDIDSDFTFLEGLIIVNSFYRFLIINSSSQRSTWRIDVIFNELTLR